mmetsp:Transcript_29393/g.75784  ORF Transcript_29393/g.75784 Transcript_29393/m.75784 type:complete len:87 (+) Transcript_29393:488-748(+)
MKEGEKLKLTHQLDYATSGIMCYGLTRKAAGEVCRLFRERLARTYLSYSNTFLKKFIPPSYLGTCLRILTALISPLRTTLLHLKRT